MSRAGRLVQALQLVTLMLAGFPASTYAQQSGAPAAITRFQGKPVPAIAASDRSGKPMRLTDLRGRIVIVNLWATWCVPCRTEMPTLERLAARYPKDLVVVAVSADEGGWPAIDRFWGPQFRHLRPALAGNQNVAAQLGALGLPYTLIVNRDGREIARVMRGADWDRGSLAALVQRHIAARKKG